MHAQQPVDPPPQRKRRPAFLVILRPLVHGRRERQQPNERARLPRTRARRRLAAGIRLRVLSLGAGVQSTTLALMAAHGEIGPMPDCAIFADTGWEPKAVYEHLAWLRSPNVLPFPVHIVSAGNLRADIVAGAQGERWASIPAFTRNVTPAGTAVPVYDDDENGEPIVVGSRISGDRARRDRHDPPTVHHRIQDRADPPKGARAARHRRPALADIAGGRAMDRHLASTRPSA